MKAPTPRRLLRYVRDRLRLRPYLREPGDGRVQPRIPAGVLVWAILISRLPRQASFHAIEQLARCSGGRALSLTHRFGDDALSYFTERLVADETRAALADVVCLAKRNKAFDNARFIGLAIDGATAGRCRNHGCALCRSFRNAKKEIIGYRHHCAAISVVDGNFATATFLHVAGVVGLPVVARLKGNLPELSAAVAQRFREQPPTHVYTEGKDRVEIWDAADFDPWETLNWKTVRVIRHHHANSILLNWLLTFLAIVIERLYRIRYLHRGNHPVRSAQQLCQELWLSLGRESSLDSS